MKRKPMIRHSEAHETLMWERWQQGESVNSIARLFDNSHWTIRGIILRTGGVRPAARATRSFSSSGSWMSSSASGSVPVAGFPPHCSTVAVRPVTLGHCLHQYASVLGGQD